MIFVLKTMTTTTDIQTDYFTPAAHAPRGNHQNEGLTKITHSATVLNFLNTNTTLTDTCMHLKFLLKMNNHLYRALECTGEEKIR